MVDPTDMTVPVLRHRRIELRASSTEEGVVTGVVTTWDDPYKIGRERSEIITRSTFDLSKPVPLFYEHDWSAGPIGVSRALKKGEQGLEAEFELFLTDSERARAVWRAMKAGALREFSIGFMVEAKDIAEARSEGGHVTETIKSGDLLEVSSVVRGANPKTDTLSTRAVPPAPVAAPAVDPATGMPLPGEEEEKATRAQVIAKIAELVDMANELGMTDQLPLIVKQMITNLAPPPAPAPAPVSGQTPVPPVAPARAMSPSMLRALRR